MCVKKNTTSLLKVTIPNLLNTQSQRYKFTHKGWDLYNDIKLFKLSKFEYVSLFPLNTYYHCISEPVIDLDAKLFTMYIHI